MDEATAKQIASDARPEHDVPAGYAIRGAERRIIEISESAVDVTPLVRDVRVWIVRYQAGIAWAELAVDEATRTVVRMQRSRAP